MTAEALINISQAVTHGNFRQVRNLKTNKQGTVVNVRDDKLTVHVGRTSEVWTYQDCEDCNTV